MGFYWNPWALPYFLALVVAFALAGLVMATRGGQNQNRALALLFVLDGSAMGWSALVYSTDDAQTAWGAQAVVTLTYFMASFAYLYLASTLHCPPSRLLRHPLAKGILALGAAGVFVLVLGWTERFYGSLYEVSYSRLEASLGPWFAVGLRLSIIPFVYALFCAAWAAWRSPHGSKQRVQATWFAGAFAVRDVSLVTFNLLAVGLLVPDSQGALLTFVLLLPPAAVIGASALLAYGILKHQLFDIDLKVKWTLRRGTLGAVFVAAFLVVAQVVQNYTSSTLGWLSGAVVAGLMLFALRPLEKAANTLADKAMPHVRDSDEYAAFRKMEVYKAAVEELSVGGISAKERRALDALREKLGVAAGAASAMERDIVAARTAA